MKFDLPTSRSSSSPAPESKSKSLKENSVQTRTHPVPAPWSLLKIQGSLTGPRLLLWFVYVAPFIPLRSNFRCSVKPRWLEAGCPGEFRCLQVECLTPPSLRNPLECPGVLAHHGVIQWQSVGCSLLSQPSWAEHLFANSAFGLHRLGRGLFYCGCLGMNKSNITSIDPCRTSTHVL